ncbi:hypothetical protein BBO99_00001024 [Phytophthora kernoviae]|uniref:Large ribosomal subunit protein mL54 n=2 Tax=Phytophthora kernoviae TaxID=325452 RepID=A0A3R7GCZ3_9STRA|nr:hypothetical protein G195_003619 [Phytophthora kernoviae 00238/432]KAG2520205.1 hypothetical protein JM16_005533 [Phytophthora kernoviae]KAG2531732.1 hypothetical protein JM18_000951 [Phytophthora kernoviae]RLN46470.1 hypothetical protein BBI17_000925 [Phytophthora kernoviae]RLN84811.1 hypothetical protein BBO99_00001024 [Phytophthora kernoviae]
MLATTRRLATRCCFKPLSGVRTFAAKGKGGAVVEEVVDLTKVVPTNILKEGSHPELKDRPEYPDWLWTLLDTKPTLGELERLGFDNLEEEQQRRYLQLSSRRAVKGVNATKAKK